MLRQANRPIYRHGGMVMSSIAGKRELAWLVWVSLLCFSLPLFLCQGCTRSSTTSEHPKKGMGAIPVSVATVVRADVPVELHAVGNVEAYSTVAIKPQVSGELMKVFFREGQSVKRGEALFAIDARTYDAQLNQVQANLAKDESALVQAEAVLARDLAQQKYAKEQAARYTSLYEKNLVSKEQSDQMNSNLDTTSAAVRADEAAIQSARANLDATRATVASARVMLGYTRIQSPIDGRTGSIDVQPGNIANPNTALTTINQIEPIYVAFSVPELQLKAIKQGQIVAATPGDKAGPDEMGKLVFTDNAVDVTTGTIRAKAVFPNPKHNLWPGQFVQVKLRLDTKPNALLLPSQAVQAGQNGSFVFVVKQDRTVESRPVVAGMRVDQNIVIEKGLEQGETVVTEGQLRLAIGSRVQFSKQ
jgi:membrane fusion protein, multidrug efflux system